MEADLPTITPTVAIAEDEEDLREAVAEYLEDRGLRVLQAGNAAAFRALVAAEAVDVAILDIQMPGEDGLSLARWLRGRSRIGIIFATAADQPVERIIGLELGADDYITKPYELRELLARVRSILRRMGDAAAPVAAPAEARRDTLAVGSLVLDSAARRLLRPDGSAVALTQGEFDLLAVLVQRAGRILSREQLAGLLHEGGGEGGRAIDIRMARIRRKLEEDDPSCRGRLRTVRGQGYVFAPEDRS
jgi:two-component system phosphate regulon response regulator OmpR